MNSTVAQHGVCALFNLSKCFRAQAAMKFIFLISHALGLSLGPQRFDEYSSISALRRARAAASNSMNSLKSQPEERARGFLWRLMDSDIRHCLTASAFVCCYSCLSAVVSADGLTCLDIASRVDIASSRRSSSRRSARSRRRPSSGRQHFSNLFRAGI